MVQNIEIDSALGEIYRRDHRKADGRMLHLYGSAPHILPVQREGSDEIVRGGELRWHPLRQEWNIYAAHRQNRTYKPNAAKDPLAPTISADFPTEIPFTDFDMAVFENKFSSLNDQGAFSDSTDAVTTASPHGCCEVIVYAPDARGDLHSLGQDKRRLLVATWIDRYRAMAQKDCAFILPFENRGQEVGVTLHHPHGQIYGFGQVPAAIQNGADAFQKGYDLAADLAAWGAGYTINEAGGVKAVCPPYARFPYEVWLVPNRRVAGLWDLTSEEADGFASLLGDMTRRYDSFFERETAYMLNVQSSPKGYEDSYHMTAQFYPLLRDKTRVKYLASVEQTTGMFTVDVMPEQAAEVLRAQ